MTRYAMFWKHSARQALRRSLQANMIAAGYVFLEWPLFYSFFQGKKVEIKTKIEVLCWLYSPERAGRENPNTGNVA